MTPLIVAITAAALVASGGIASAQDAGDVDTSDARAGFYDTPWPMEHTDRWRSHAAPGGLPADVTSDQLVVTSVELPADPFLGYTRDPGEVFVLGGSEVALGLYSDISQVGQDTVRPTAEEIGAEIQALPETPWIARIATDTMEAQTMDLDQGSAVNYPDGALVHANGDVYAVAKGMLYRIDGDDFTITDTLELPILQKSDGSPDHNTTYNGVQVTADGDLLLKGADMFGTTPAGLLLRLDPDDLSTVSQLETSDLLGTPRVTIASQSDGEYIYHSSPTESFRILVTDDGFEVDDAWTQTYRVVDEGWTQASSPIFMGDLETIVFANNTLPHGVKEPMQVFRQSTGPDGELSAPQQAFEPSEGQVNFWMVAADPFVSDIMVVEDQAHGLVAGWQVGNDGTFERVWEADQYDLTGGAAISYTAGHVYVDDLRCDDGGDCQLHLAVLDLSTGEQLAEVAVEGDRPAMAQIFIDQDSVYLIAPQAGEDNGYLNRITVG